MTLREQLPPETFIELYIRQNLSLEKIGELFDVSRQRVHQYKKEIEKEYGRINRRLFIDVISLKHFLDQGWNAKEIAQHYDMKPSKISRLIRKYKEEYENGSSNIKISRKTAKDLITRQELYYLYVQELYTDQEIAKKYNLSPSTINSLRKEYRIPTNNKKSLRKLPNLLPKETFCYYYLEKNLTLQEMADKFACNVMAMMSLKEKYEIKK